MVALISGWMLSKISPAAHPIHYKLLNLKPDSKFKTMAEIIVNKFKKWWNNDENKHWGRISVNASTVREHDASYSHTQRVGINSSIARNYSSFNNGTKQRSSSRAKHVKKSSFIEGHTSWGVSRHSIERVAPSPLSRHASFKRQASSKINNSYFQTVETLKRKTKKKINQTARFSLSNVS